jgi:Fe-S cluster biosynthesis and repair protein YggX/cytochrome c-type biogenesis protein CcmH/NrfG
MAEIDTRIEQFKKMASDDPSNELGHFSLGRAYFEAGRYDEAAESFERVIQLNSNLSRAYHLLASTLLKQGKRDAAVERLTQGVRIAHARGDMMPKNEMMKMLQELGAALPELKSEAAQVQVGEGQVLCKRCGQVKPRLASPPFRNDFGKEIYENICTDCWREAIGQGTKVINELRLPMNDPQAHKIWDQHIREFLNLPK